MKLIVGLGNPGAQYETTRHNVGFLAVDRLVEEFRASGPVNRNQGQLFQADFSIDGTNEKILLIQPQTFMNLSGRCVGALFHFNKCKPEDLIVIHDELDLDPGVIRLKTGGGTGGHNGLKSIDESLGKDNNHYHRIRIGIGHPARNPETASGKGARAPGDYVLEQFSDDELSRLDTVLDEVTKAVREILNGRIQQAMNQIHRGSQSGSKPPAKA